MLSKSFGVAGITAIALCSQAALAVPAHSPHYDTNSQTEKQRAAAVKEAFQFAWDGYYKYAFPHDELHPVSNGYSDSRCVAPIPNPEKHQRLTSCAEMVGAQAQLTLSRPQS
jgi:hypothetical protein